MITDRLLTELNTLDVPFLATNKQADYAPIMPVTLLSVRQRPLSGQNLNWLATYEHAAQRLIKRLERERLWAM